MSGLRLKRAVELAILAPALPLLLPLLGLAVLATLAALGRPVLFRQARPGLHGKIFRMYKLRTMNENRDDQGRLLPDQDRLTGFGRFMRASSLDELPSLLNVLKGDMALVGPRPLLVDYLPLYSPEQARRHDVRPGLTGWAQVNGRNAVDWPKRLAMDVWYVDNRSLRLDLKILAMTVLKVLRREGINETGSATMTRFTGAPDPEPTSSTD